MTAKTHITVGCAVSLLITHPSNAKDMITCLGISAIGSVISDIDVTTSESKKGLKKIIAVTVAAIAVTLLCDSILHTNIISRFQSNENIMRLILGFFMFIFICIFGEHQPHRSFMHSILGLSLIIASSSVIWAISAKYMAVSMASHIIIDMLNKKRIQLFYPLKKPRIGFNICYSDGLVNMLLFHAGGIVCVGYIVLTSYDIIKGFF